MNFFKLDNVNVKPHIRNKGLARKKKINFQTITATDKLGSFKCLIYG